MATYSFHRLIIGKVEIDHLFCLNGYSFFLPKCLLNSPLRFIRLLFESLNLIGCQGDKRVNFLEKKVKKNLFLTNHKVDEAGTLHTCL